MIKAGDTTDILQQLQVYQTEYDKDFFQINDDEFSKIRHITLHLMKTVGKMANYCEIIEHNLLAKTLIRNSDRAKDSVVNEVIPDLLMHSLQLANLFNSILGKSYFERVEKNKSKPFLHKQDCEE